MAQFLLLFLAGLMFGLSGLFDQMSFWQSFAFMLGVILVAWSVPAKRP